MSVLRPQAGAIVAPARQRLLKSACSALHIAVMVYIIAGWLLPWLPARIFYLVFLPAVVLHWQLNRGTCVLNNLESFLLTGRWRNPANPEEGAWFKTLVERTLGIRATTAQVDAFLYVAMMTLWSIGLLSLGLGRFLSAS